MASNQHYSETTLNEMMRTCYIELERGRRKEEKACVHKAKKNKWSNMLTTDESG